MYFYVHSGFGGVLVSFAPFVSVLFALLGVMGSVDILNGMHVGVGSLGSFCSVFFCFIIV